MRILLETDAWIAVAFNVPVADLIAAADLPRHRSIATLGPDLLGGAFPVDEAVRRLRLHPGTAIGPALLDQTIVAGIGNVYKSETLFLSGVHPDTLLATLDRQTLAVILGHARRLLQINAASGQSRRTTGRLHPGERLWVYGRGGRPCRRCGTPIERRVIASRSTYWCPACQIR